MGPAALKTVTSLDFTLQLIQNYRHPNQYQRNCSTYSFSGDLSSAAGSELAPLLTAACPNVSRLGMSGGLGDEAMRLLGSQLPKLTILEVLETGWLKLFGSTHPHDVLLPSITHMKMVDTQSCADDFLQIRRCLALTHLEVGDGWLEGNRVDQWLLLPPALKTLRCGNLPDLKTAQQLHLPHLATLQVTDSTTDRLDVEVLAALLKAAPSLQLLVTLHGVSDTLSVNRCSPSVLDDMWRVHQRIWVHDAGGRDLQLGLGPGTPSATRAQRTFLMRPTCPAKLP